MARLAALRRHWRKHPRVEWLKSAQMGYRAPDTRPARQGTLADLLAQHGVKPGQRRSF